jgi:mRNA-degrading endonuclease HigB of HigAB toxin-antitoxin module
MTRSLHPWPRRRGYKDHGALKAALDAWFDEVRKARRSSAAHVKRSYATASIVSPDRIVFNIKGNDYRLVVAVDFEKSIVWIKWIMPAPATRPNRQTCDGLRSCTTPHA